MQDPRYRECSKQDVHLHRPRASHLQQRIHDDDNGHILGKVRMRADRAPEVAIVAIPESDLVSLLAEPSGCVSGLLSGRSAA